MTISRAEKSLKTIQPELNPISSTGILDRRSFLSRVTLAERKLALQAAPVFMYIFAYESQEPVLPGVSFPAGAAHAAEIPFKFNHPGGSLNSDSNPERAGAARNMSRAWASFARNSDPSHDEIPKWPAYTLDQRATMFLDAECRVVNDPYREERPAMGLNGENMKVQVKSALLGSNLL